ncbi:MAG: HAD family hydrolase [Kofleriaceae bacterium]|nr:HAD family hydrolase [Kofleriaceae bacterium]
MTSSSVEGCTPGECELIIFDLDGTLINSFSDIRRSILVGFDAVSLPWREEFMELVFKGVGLQRFYEESQGESIDLQPERFSAMVKAYREDYSSESENCPYPHAEELLRDLRRLRPDTRLAIATTKPSVMAKHVLKSCKLDTYFDTICGTDDLPHKPNPALLHKVCSDNDKTPAKAIMVGDTDKDIGAAHAAPMTSVGICHGGYSRGDMSALNPSHLVDDLRDLHALLL